MLNRYLITSAFAGMLVSGIAALPSTASALSHCAPCPYECSTLGLGKSDCSMLSNAGGVCCLDLTEKGHAVATERERVLGSQVPAPQAVQREQCPSGFQPSEQKCTPKERKNGCKDMRLPGGLGCVNR